MLFRLEESLLQPSMAACFIFAVVGDEGGEFPEIEDAVVAETKEDEHWSCWWWQRAWMLCLDLDS